MTLEEAKTLIGMMLAAYPNMQVNENMPKVWHECLKSISIADALKALKVHILKSKWPPSIAEINEVVTLSATPEHLKLSGQEAINDRNHPISKKVWLELERMYGPWGQWKEEDNKWRIKEGVQMFEAYKSRQLELVKTGKTLPPDRDEAKEVLGSISKAIGGIGI